MTTEGTLLYGEAVSATKITLMKRGNSNQIYEPRSLPNIKSPGSRDPSFAPDGNSLAYVTHSLLGRAEQKLRIVALDGRIVREVSLRPEFHSLQRPAFSPDGTKIALQAQDRTLPKVVVVSAQTGALLKVFEFDRDSAVAQSGWSKDSRLLYARLIRRDASLHLETVDIETGRRSSSSLPGKNLYWPGGVSPDGKLFAIGVSTPSDPRKRRIVLRSLSDGTDRLLEADDLDSSAVWDFDSRHIFYRKDEKHLCRLSIEGGTKEVLSVDLNDPVLQDVSRDGKYLAFREDASDRRIWAVENFLPKAKSGLAAR
jgi:Tol biopolymer transport system component